MVTTRIHNRWKKFHPFCTGSDGLFIQICIAGNDQAGIAHDRIDFPAQNAADPQLRMPVVAMKNGIIIIHDIGNPVSSQDSFHPVRNPGQYLVFQPQQIIPSAGGNSKDSMEISRQYRCRILRSACVQPFQIVFPEQRECIDLYPRCFQKGKILIIP